MKLGPGTEYILVSDVTYLNIHVGQSEVRSGGMDEGCGVLCLQVGFVEAGESFTS